MRKLTKLALFNVAFVILAILMFSSKGLGLAFDPGIGPGKFALSISVALFGLAVFFLTNGMILLSPDKVSYQIDKLDTIDDCIGALMECMKTDPSFKEEIGKAIEQLKTLRRRRESLATLLEQNSVSESFKTLHQTANKAEYYAFSNVKSIINRLIVFDNKEYLQDPDSVDIKSHKAYINEKLESNKLILKEYSDMLLALSAIGDTQDVDIGEIRDMTAALNSVLKRDEFKSLERKYQEDATGVQIH